MKRFAVIILSCLLVLSPITISVAQDAPIVMIEKNTGGGNAFAYEDVTVDDTVGGVPLTAATYTTAARKAFITCETAQIRWRIDSGAPTTTVGHTLTSGESLVLCTYSQIVRFRAIKTGVTSATIRVTYLQ